MEEQTIVKVPLRARAVLPLRNEKIIFYYVLLLIVNVVVLCIERK